MQLTSTWTDTLLFQNQFSQEGNCGFLTAMVTDCVAKRPMKTFESFNFLIYHSSFIYLCVQCLWLPRDHRAWDQHRLLWGSDPVAGSGESSSCPHPGDPVLLSSTSLNLTLTASPHPRLTLLPQSNTLHCLHCPPHWIGAGGCLITFSQFPLERQSVFLHFTFSVNHSWADCSEWDRGCNSSGHVEPGCGWSH